MNDDFADLEAELKTLRPRAPSRQLEARIASALPVGDAGSAPARREGRSRAGFATATSWTSWKWAMWSAAASFAVLATAFAVWSSERAFHWPPGAGTQDESAVAGIYKPMTADKVLYDSREEGLVTLEDGTTGRQVRDRYVDTITWRNPATRSSLTWSVPRDEVRVVPVTFN